MARFETNFAHRPSARQHAFGLLSLLSAVACGDVRDKDDERYSSELYLDRSYSALERAADLVAQLTLSEKALLMNSSQSAAVPRLSLSAYGWWNEAIHGVAREQTVGGGNPEHLINTTSYPVSLSVGATWNGELVYREAIQISDEAREVFRNNSLDLNMYSPTINLARDPRWGRNDETFSEDPLLTAELAAQFVSGMEGKDQSGQPLAEGLGYRKVSTTLKHFAANNSEFNRLWGSSDVDERTLREYYTAQFRRVIGKAHPAALMTSYNSVNGVPTSASVYLMDTLARQTFGFDGFITSDCDSIREIQAGHGWQAPGFPEPVDAITRHAFANSAGEDLNCHQGYHDEYNFGNALPQAVAQRVATPTGTYNENDLDVSVARLLAARIGLGELDTDRFDTEPVPWVALARARVPRGSWSNAADNQAVTETPERLELARAIASESIVLLQNRDTTLAGGTTGKLLPLKVPQSGPYRVAVVGYYAEPSPLYLGGYSSEQQGLGVSHELSGYAGLRAAILALNPGAVIDHLPGVTSEALDEIDASAVEAAANYDVVVVYLGDDARHSSEDLDRRSLALPGAQAALASAVAARNSNTIVYLETAGAVDVASFQAQVPALLWSSYNGQRKGRALADVLLGVTPPSGHLPFTWYADAAELPDLADYSIRPNAGSLGRTYMYFQGRILYPFGYGQSYTSFSYSAFAVERAEVDANDSLTLHAQVTNTGALSGAEVVQLYVSTPDAAPELERPRQRLCAFRKLVLAPGETRSVDFTLPVPELAFFDEQRGRYAVDAGEYRFALATSSADADLQQELRVRVTGSLRAVPRVVSAKPQLEGDAAAGIVQRVIFPRDAVVLPALTVAFSDDTLYGYIRRGQSTPLPPELGLELRSNRPEIASVDAQGVLRTGSLPGVATITASVDSGGVRAATEFVIYVR
jgi:beta-glucosidase